MSDHGATIAWTRADQTFVDNRYTRTHQWRFDGGAEVHASASPSNVRPPFSDSTAVDPEEAFVASIASCHMLWFLYFAAQRKLLLDTYVDAAVGTLAPNAAGKPAFTRVALRPKLTWANQPPTAEVVAELHHHAHANCFIANSVTCEIVIEPG